MWRPRSTGYTAWRQWRRPPACGRVPAFTSPVRTLEPDHYTLLTLFTRELRAAAPRSALLRACTCAQTLTTATQSNGSPIGWAADVLCKM